MRISKVKSRSYNGKDYYKFRINLPKKIIDEANLTEKDELMINVKKEALEIIKKQDKNSQ